MIILQFILPGELERDQLTSHCHLPAPHPFLFLLLFRFRFQAVSGLKASRSSRSLQTIQPVRSAFPSGRDTTPVISITPHF